MDRQKEPQSPDVVVMEKTASKGLIIDIACPVDNNLIQTLLRLYIFVVLYWSLVCLNHSK